MRTKKPRGAQLVVVDTPEGPMQLVHWHLGLAEKERHWQVNHLLTHHLFREADALPVLVAGDCNDWRNTLAAGPFARHGFAHVDGADFALPLVSGLLADGLARQGLHPGRRPRAPAARVVQDSKLARRASDHLPLVIDFHLTREHFDGRGGTPIGTEHGREQAQPDAESDYDSSFNASLMRASMSKSPFSIASNTLSRFTRES